MRKRRKTGKNPKSQNNFCESLAVTVNRSELISDTKLKEVTKLWKVQHDRTLDKNYLLYQSACNERHDSHAFLRNDTIKCALNLEDLDWYVALFVSNKSSIFN